MYFPSHPQSVKPEASLTKNDCRTHDCLLIKHLGRNWGYTFGSELQLKQEMLKYAGFLHKGP
jgi:hypothetical protein